MKWWDNIPIILTSFCEKLNPLLGRVKLDASNKCEIDIEFLCNCFKPLKIKFKNDKDIDNQLVYDKSKPILKSKNALNVNQIAQHFTQSIKKTGKSKQFIFVGSHSKLMTEICKQYLGKTIKVEFDNLDILCIEQLKNDGIWTVIKLYKLRYKKEWLCDGGASISYNTDEKYRYIFLIRHCIGCHNIFSGWQKIKAGTGPNPLTKYALCVPETRGELQARTGRYLNLINGGAINIDNVGFWSSIVFRAILTTVMFGSNLKLAIEKSSEHSTNPS